MDSYSYYTIFLDDIDGGNNEADSSSVGCNPYSFFSRSTACFRLSDALTSNYLNWDGTNHVDCLSDPALTTGLVFESQTLSSQSERPLVPSSIIKRFLIVLPRKADSLLRIFTSIIGSRGGLDLDTVRHMQQHEKRRKGGCDHEEVGLVLSCP